MFKITEYSKLHKFILYVQFLINFWCRVLFNIRIERFPSTITKHKNGFIDDIIYANKHCKCHRTGDKPSSMTFYDNGNINKVMYCINSVIHRDTDNPAVIDYDEHGIRVSQMYYKNGKVHRDIGKPAYITYLRGHGDLEKDYTYVYHNTQYFYNRNSTEAYEYRVFRSNVYTIDDLMLNCKNKNDYIRMFCNWHVLNYGENSSEKNT